MTLLKISEITKKYGGLLAVDNISFELKAGEILGLLGPNGAGKSTTISMISTLTKPNTGDILFQGSSIVSKPKAFQKVLGVVPQEIALYPTLSGYDNLKFWGHAYGLRGRELKERISAVSEIIGISDRLKDKVENYSGGMKRRINIGAALLHKPEILIMDEPTVGIDPQSRNHILETVKKLNQEGMTIIYTSHYMEEVAFLCNRIAIMDEGKIIAEGTKEELIRIVGGKKKVHLTLGQVNESILDGLRKIDYVEQIDEDENTLVLTFDDRDEFFQDIAKAIEKSQGSILSFDVENPNLEGVFLHLTGKELRD